MGEEEEEEEYEYFCEMCEECGEEFDEEEKFKRHQHTCNPAVNFNPLVSTMNYEPPENRLHIIGQRLCEQCGITDISNKPDSHTRCYKCYSGENDYMLEGGGRRTMHNHSRHNSYGEGRGRGGRRGPYTRECREEEKFKRHQRTCNPAVNFNPLVSTMNYEPPETRLHIIGHRLCEQCGITDISNKPDSHTRCYNCYSGENDYMLQGGGRRTMHNHSRHNSYGEGRGRGGRRGPYT